MEQQQPCDDAAAVVKFFAASMKDGTYIIGMAKLCPVHGNQSIPLMTFPELGNLLDLYSAVQNLLDMEPDTPGAGGPGPGSSVAEDYLRELTGVPEVPEAPDMPGIPGAP